jgi:glutathione S-transferase
LYSWPPADGLPSSSPYCLKIQYALQAYGVPHRVEYVKGRLPEWIISGRLPAAEIDGARLEDSTSILKALARARPAAASLYPVNAARAAETNLLEEWADEVLALQLVYHRWAVEKNFARLMPQAFGPEPSPRRDEFVKAALDFHMSVFRDRGIAALTDEERLARFAEMLEVLEQRLARGPFLTGNEATAADFAVFCPLHVMRAAEIAELTGPLGRHRPIQDWMKRMAELSKA